MLKNFGRLSIVALISIFLSGCFFDSIDKWAADIDRKTITEKEKKAIEARKPGFIISIHEIVDDPKTNKIERYVPCFLDERQKECVNINYFLHSKNIRKIERIPREGLPGFYDLKLYLDLRGRIKYEALSMNFKGQQVGLLVDGLFYRAVTADIIEDEEQLWTFVEGPFDKVVSSNIVKKAPVNYRFYNKTGLSRSKELLNFDKLFKPQ